MIRKRINKIFGSIYDDIINDTDYFDTIISNNDITNEKSYNDNNNNNNNNIENLISTTNNENDIIYNEHSINRNDPIYSHYFPKSYRDFDTIDWLNEIIVNKLDSIAIKSNLLNNKNCFNFLRYIFEMISGWIVMLALGSIGGILVPLILIGGEWLTDIRQGYCSKNFTNNFYDCCRLTKTSYSYSSKCVDWITWGDFFGIKNVTFIYIFNYAIYIFISILFAGMAAHIVKLISPYSCGTAITEVKTILSGFVIKGFLGIRASYVRFVCALLTIGSGLNISHEGVLIHVCSSIANWLSRPIKKFNSNAAKLREVIGAGACAGFSVAFSAPISGLLFGLESMCYSFPSKTVWRTFTCVLFSTFMFMQFKHMVDTDQTLLYISSSGIWHFRELIPFSFLGIIAGLSGAFFKFILIKWSLFRKKSIIGNYPITEVIILALITSLVSFPIQVFRGGNYGTLRYIFSGCLPYNIDSICDYQPKIEPNNTNIDPYKQSLIPNTTLKAMIWKLPLFAIIKLILTALTTSCKIPTGFFLPIFIVGGCFGRSIGITLQFLHLKYADSNFFKIMCLDTNRRCIHPEIYAIVGACAFLSGVTHLTITLVVLIVELTNKDNCIIPLMLCVTIAKLISEKLVKLSIFQCQSEINNYPYMDQILDNSLKKSFHTNIESLCLIQRTNNYKYILLYENEMTLSDIFHILGYDYFGYPLLDNNIDKKLIGYVKRHELLNLINILVITEQNDESALNCHVTFSLYNNCNNTCCINLSSVIDYNIIQVDSKTGVDVIAEYFQLLGIRNILVTSHGSFIGIVTKKDFLSVL